MCFMIRRAIRACLIVGLCLIGLTVALVLPWRWVSPPTTAFIVRERMASGEPVYYQWAPRGAIPTDLAISVVAAEDQKFPDHKGFDWVAIRAAFESNQLGGRVRGASTISQQVAKNLFLWPGQTWLRKGMEAYLTLWIELLWPKRRILEVYLNVAQFGPTVFGASAAAQRLLNKPVADLTPRDAAVLSAVLPSPRRMSAREPSEYVLGRAWEIQDAVRRLGGPGYLQGL